MGVGPGQRGAGPTPAGLRVPGMSGPAAAGGRRPRRRGSACGAAAQLPFWFFDCGRRSAARKATACADASGPRARELIPENAPLRWEKFAPEPCAPRPLYRPISLAPEGKQEQVATTRGEKRAMTDSVDPNAIRKCMTHERMRTNCARIAAPRGNRTTRSRKDRQRGRKSGYEQEFTDSANNRKKGATKFEQKWPKKSRMTVA